MGGIGGVGHHVAPTRRRQRNRPFFFPKTVKLPTNLAGTTSQSIGIPLSSGTGANCGDIINQSKFQTKDDTGTVFGAAPTKLQPYLPQNWRVGLLFTIGHTGQLASRPNPKRRLFAASLHAPTPLSCPPLPSPPLPPSPAHPRETKRRWVFGQPILQELRLVLDGTAFGGQVRRGQAQLLNAARHVLFQKRNCRCHH
jgi:hypothetical protein